MVLAGVRTPFSQNPTGLVPTFNGTPVNVSEIGFTPGKNTSSVRAFDSVESRKGYSGLYQFGALLQSRKVHVADESDTAVRQLPFVLDGEPGSLARGPERSKRLGRDACLRLEPGGHQPEQHAAQSDVAEV